MKIAARLTLAAALALVSACKQEASAPDASPSASPSAGAASATAGPEAKPGISVGDGKLVLPAVKGRPGAAYFMLSNSDTKPVTLAAISIEGAGKTEIHESKGGSMALVPTVNVRPGEMVMFERGGKHVMAFDLAPTIKPGGTVQMTLAFSDGDKLSLPLRVEAAGGGNGMDHGGMH